MSESMLGSSVVEGKNKAGGGFLGGGSQTNLLEEMKLLKEMQEQSGSFPPLKLGFFLVSVTLFPLFTSFFICLSWNQCFGLQSEAFSVSFVSVNS